MEQEQNCASEIKDQKPKKGYFVRTFLVATVCVPLLVSIFALIIIVWCVMVVGVNDKLVLALVITILTIVVSILLWNRHAKNVPLPDSFARRFAPVFSA